MKKVFSILTIFALCLSIFSIGYAKTNSNNNEISTTKTKKDKTYKKKDVLSDQEYKELKTQFFNAEGYGDNYLCKVEQEKWCKVKDLDTGFYVLCDRQVSRTQWESAKIFFLYGRCVKLN